MSLVENLDMILSKRRITKALIRLRGCAGWSAHLLFANPVFGVSEATEANYKIENSLVESLDMILFKKRITKALTRLRGCAGYSAPLLFANTEDRFSRADAQLLLYINPSSATIFALKMSSAFHIFKFVRGSKQYDCFHLGPYCQQEQKQEKAT